MGRSLLRAPPRPRHAPVQAALTPSRSVPGSSPKVLLPEAAINRVSAMHVFTFINRCGGSLWLQGCQHRAPLGEHDPRRIIDVGFDKCQEEQEVECKQCEAEGVDHAHEHAKVGTAHKHSHGDEHAHGHAPGHAEFQAQEGHGGKKHKHDHAQHEHGDAHEGHSHADHSHSRSKARLTYCCALRIHSVRSLFSAVLCSWTVCLTATACSGCACQPCVADCSVILTGAAGDDRGCTLWHPQLRVLPAPSLPSAEVHCLPAHDTCSISQHSPCAP